MSCSKPARQSMSTAGGPSKKKRDVNPPLEPEGLIIHDRSFKGFYQCIFCSISFDDKSLAEQHYEKEIGISLTCHYCEIKKKPSEYGTNHKAYSKHMLECNLMFGVITRQKYRIGRKWIDTILSKMLDERLYGTVHPLFADLCPLCVFFNDKRNGHHKRKDSPDERARLPFEDVEKKLLLHLKRHLEYDTPLECIPCIFAMKGTPFITNRMSDDCASHLTSTHNLKPQDNIDCYNMFFSSRIAELEKLQQSIFFRFLEEARKRKVNSTVTDPGVSPVTTIRPYQLDNPLAIALLNYD